MMATAPQQQQHQHQSQWAQVAEADGTLLFEKKFEKIVHSLLLLGQQQQQQQQQPTPLDLMMDFENYCDLVYIYCVSVSYPPSPPLVTRAHSLTHNNDDDDSNIRSSGLRSRRAQRFLRHIRALRQRRLCPSRPSCSPPSTPCSTPSARSAGSSSSSKNK